MSQHIIWIHMLQHTHNALTLMHIHAFLHARPGTHSTHTQIVSFEYGFIKKHNDQSSETCLMELSLSVSCLLALLYLTSP